MSTTVLIDLAHLTGTATNGASTGMVEVRYSKRIEPADPASQIVVVRSFAVKLDATGKASVVVPPSEVDGFYTWAERVEGGITRYTSVPDVPTVNYRTLVDVDPATFDPTVDATAAWYLALDNLDVKEAVETYLLANPVSAPVSSVNGKVGAVTLDADDVGALATETLPASLVDAKGDLLVATAADTVARLPVGSTTGHVLTVDPAEAAGMKWAAGGGGGITLAPSVPPVVGEYFPVLAYDGRHENFQLISGRLIPCPVLVETAGNTDAVSLYVESGAADVTVELALYSWGRTASHVATLGTVDVASPGLKTITFTPRALAAGMHVVVARPIGGNVTVWGITGGAMVVQRGPNGGTNGYAFPFAAAGSMSASIAWDYNAGIYGNAVPKLMLRRSL